MDTRPLIATVIGDPSGIGPEVCVKALATGHPAGGSSNTARRQRERAGGVREDLRHLLRFEAVEHPEDANDTPTVVSVLDPGNLSLSAYAAGSNSRATNRAALEWIRITRSLAEQGRVAGWILAPVNDKALRLASTGTASEDLGSPPELFSSG